MSNPIKVNNLNNDSPQNLTPSITSDSIGKLENFQLIIELDKRGLITTGTFIELKLRLSQYLSGESLPSDFTALVKQHF
ncbi:Retrotrans gag domain-containing protein [Aphis craccivora]|uniref:Retrotrans gag domain-containing protein n=1 Tax=Aphis craccivora TaxID=307492 RepID=A0A6G0XEC8_APHCR|nr:Retrotrans gag domain-containing protein [Aphis craccivora]